MYKIPRWRSVYRSVYRQYTDLYTDNIQKLEEEKCEFTAQISISWSLQNSLKAMFVNDKVS